VVWCGVVWCGVVWCGVVGDVLQTVVRADDGLRVFRGSCAGALVV
jgi:hypothetical protein